MSWLFSRALVADCLPRICSDGERSALLSWIGTADAFLHSDKMTDTYAPHSRFGMTFVPLTADRGAGVLMSFLEGFRARLTAQPLRGKTLQTISGRKCDGSWQMSLPRYVFAENVDKQAIDAAADDLEEMGYETRAVSLGAADLGGDHIRERYWLLAYADDKSELLRGLDAEMAGSAGLSHGVWATKPDEPRMDDGMADRVERYFATGNGWVPVVAVAALVILTPNAEVTGRPLADGPA
jgi:hypothetical protein